MESLRPHPRFGGRPGPVLLIVMDGVGYGPSPEGDAVAAAYKPTLDWLHAHAPHRSLKAHGTAVGMPSDEDMGNSEVGHNAIGCGRVFAQGARLVNEAIAEGRLFAGAVWRELTGQVRTNGGTLHFLGLFSDGNVHSHLNHLMAMIDRAAAEGVGRVRVHALLDGRDVPPYSALEYVDPFEAFLAGHRAAGRDYRIASGGGRMYVTMDRYEADWNIVARGWQTHVRGEGRLFPSARAAIETFRAEKPGIKDQDLPPFVIGDGGQAVGPVRDGDAVILYNFRGDRAIEISKAFERETFTAFARGPRPDVLYAGMMQYDGDEKVPARYLVEPPAISRTVGEFLSRAGVRQLAISETQKFGHVTYFYNGNRTGKFDDKLEHYVEVPSDRLSFAERPWMKAAQITDRVLGHLKRGRDKFYRINFPNGDMVGHTGDFQAARIAVETVDLCLARLLPAIEAAKGIAIITADHGNCDEMYERDKKSGKVQYGPDGKPKAKTAHTLNPVPVLLYDPLFAGEYRIRPGADLGIASLAATSLNLLGFQEPDDYLPGVVEFG